MVAKETPSTGGPRYFNQHTPPKKGIPGGHVQGLGLNRAALKNFGDRGSGDTIDEPARRDLSAQPVKVKVKSGITPQIHRAGRQTGAFKPVYTPGWEWAASCAPAAKSCVG